ncbi:hypothetical protein AAVH_08999 [Aphelenchoides avenae]|nr:hypothetical protein AAVH_08999 [Aphelenchus avenae]
MTKFPYFEACSKNAATNEFFQRQIDKCDYRVASAKFLCDFQCKWTSNGYCVELRRGGPDPADDHNVFVSSAVEGTNRSPSDFDIEVNYPTTEPQASVYLHSPRDPTVNASAVPLIGAPHMVIMPVSLNFIEVYEILEASSESQLSRDESSSILHTSPARRHI